VQSQDRQKNETWQQKPGTYLSSTEPNGITFNLENNNTFAQTQQHGASTAVMDNIPAQSRLTSNQNSNSSLRLNKLGRIEAFVQATRTKQIMSDVEMQSARHTQLQMA
jgi:hypothetical protein